MCDSCHSCRKPMYEDDTVSYADREQWVFCLICAARLQARIHDVGGPQNRG